MNNSILLIDDNIEFTENFARQLGTKAIEVIHRRSYDEMVEILPECYHKLAAIVLDVKCLMRKDQKVEHHNFITAALSYLDQNYPEIPRFILTGDADEFNEFKDLFINEKFDIKTPEGLLSLNEKLKFCINHSSTVRLIRENQELFQIFNTNKMDNYAEQMLIEILKDGLDEKKFNNFKEICIQIRSFQELIYKSINKRNKKVIPDYLIRQNGMIDFNTLMKHLSGNPDRNYDYNPSTMVFQNKTISNLANTIYWSCGEYVHEETDRTYKISHNTIKSLIYALMELLIWSKQY